MSSNIPHIPPPALGNAETLEFVHQESILDYFRAKIKSGLFRVLTKKSLTLFLKGRDRLSVYPQAVGIHESTITGLIDHLSAVGYSDFLIDIGANIGLTSCQNGNSFKLVHMFEPNPYCCKILEVNSAIALESTEYHIHNCGLGDEDKESLLSVPRNNWGGAFIRDKTNSYDDGVLASKDEYRSLIDSNYLTVSVEIRKTSVALSKLFKSLLDRGLSCGVVKIDVEGYEPAILRGISESIPSQIKLFIVFESWNPNCDMKTIVESFEGRATPYKFVREVPWKRTWPKALKAVALLINPRIIHRVVTNNSHDWRGDIVLQII